MAFDPKELRRIIDTEPPDDGVECARCHQLMEVHDGFDPGPICDRCAQTLVMETIPELLDAIEARDAEIDGRERTMIVDRSIQDCLRGEVAAKEQELREADRELDKMRDLMLDGVRWSEFDLAYLCVSCGDRGTGRLGTELKFSRDAAIVRAGENMAQVDKLRIELDEKNKQIERLRLESTMNARAWLTATGKEIRVRSALSVILTGLRDYDARGMGENLPVEFEVPPSTNKALRKLITSAIEDQAETPNLNPHVACVTMMLPTGAFLADGTKITIVRDADVRGRVWVEHQDQHTISLAETKPGGDDWERCGRCGQPYGAHEIDTDPPTTKSCGGFRCDQDHEATGTTCSYAAQRKDA